MSYLPRMSKTYKEPEERTYEDPTKEITFNSIPIASALPDDKAFNPQTVLKQYSFYPHPPPQLPGPSLIDEVEQNEKINEEARRRRSREDNKLTVKLSKVQEERAEQFPYKSKEKEKTVNIALTGKGNFKVDGITKISKGSGNSTETNVTLNGRVLTTVRATNDDLGGAPEKSLGSWIENSPTRMTEVNKTEATSGSSCTKEPHSKIFESSSSENNTSKTMDLPKVELLKSSISCDYEKTENAASSSNANMVVSKIKGTDVADEGIQCSPVGNTEKIFTVPPSIHHMLRTLSFLIQELDKNKFEECQTKEEKKLVTQINEAIASLSKYKIDTKFSLQTSLSDTKRLEKIFNDLRCYVKEAYGENGDLGHRSDEKKRIFCELIQKEYELRILNEKLRESEIQNPILKGAEQTTKAPEIMLQNKDLENEQLVAEIEFNAQELRRFQHVLAEKDWEIEKSKEEVEQLKKKLATLKPRFKNDISFSRGGYSKEGIQKKRKTKI